MQRIAGGDSKTEIARRAGIDKSHPTKWSQGEVASIPFARAFARAYNRPVLEALVACGVITADEASVQEIPADIATFPEEMLAEELLRRIRARSVGRLDEDALRRQYDIAASPDGTQTVTDEDDLDA